MLLSLNSKLSPWQVTNCVVWLGYGLVLGDPFIILPNFLGLWLGIAQVLALPKKEIPGMQNERR
jgi:hypothetical protein